jgi:hypothetical protein
LAADPHENPRPSGVPPALPQDQPRFAVGDTVELVAAPRYLKSADPMPMLRPPDLVDPGELGLITEIRPLDQLAVRFRRGTFLLAASALRPGSPAG